MAVTQNSYTGNNSKREYDFTFPYLKQTEIKATLDGTATTAFSHPSATSIQFNTAPGTGVKIKIFRETDSDSLPATFYAGSALKSEDLNDNFTQNLYATQEVTERYLSNLGGTMTGDLQLGEDVVVKFEGATDNDYETTLTVTDPTADRTITFPDITGTVITTADTGTVATTMIANDAINGTKIADNAVDSEHIAADSLDTEHYAPASVDTTALATDSVTTNKITALNVTTAKIANLAVGTNQIAADAINGGKIADNSIDSEHYVDGSIDTAHIGDDQVTAAKLANTSVTAGTYSAADLTVDSQGRITAASSGTIATSEIANDAINGTKLADNAVDSEHYTDGSIDHVHLANDIIDGDNIQDDVIDSEHYAAGSIDTEHIANLQVTTAKLAADAVTGAKIADDQVDSEHIVAGALDNEHYAAGSITSDKLNAATVVTASEQGSATANDTSFFTTSAADARYFNVSTGDTIKDGQTFPDNDTTIATTAAINDRIIDLVDDVGGFVPIANETSFPTANPDVNNGAGTLVSIKALSSNLVSDGSGVATISNGAGSGNTVTINGLANSTTYAATFGMIVETTTTLHTYAFHRLVPKATEVSTVSGSISNVNTVAGSISNVNTVASNNSNVTTVAGVSSNVTTVAGISSNVTTVAGISSDVTAVAGDATDIGAVAAKATEIGRLGTADAVSDLNTLGTTAIVSDLDTCATNVSSINTAAGSISNINTVATNISNVNDFSDKYRVASSAPSSNNDAGDLYFDTTSNELRVYNGSAWQGGVTATGNLAGLGANTFTGNQSLGDSLKVQLGTGNDLQLYHNGSHSFITTTTGNLALQAHSHIQLKPGNGEDGIEAVSNGPANLYYDNVKKFNTSSDGASCHGSLSFGDNAKVKIGNSSDLQIYHDGNNSHIDNNTGELRLHSPSSIKLFHNSSLKYYTDSDGLRGGDNVKLKFGDSQDLQIYHDGNKSVIQDIGTGDLQLASNAFRANNAANTENMITANENAEAALWYDNSKKLETYSGGVRLSGELLMQSNHAYLNDNAKLRLGTSQDLEIYHDGSNSYLKAVSGGTGDLYIFADGKTIYLRPKSGEDGIKVIPDGGVELYYDNAKKLETTSAGATVTGSISTNTGGGAAQLGTHLDLGDNQKARFGASDDLQIYHDGTNSNLHNATGEFKIRGNDVRLMNAAGNEHMLIGTANDKVILYYDNTNKFETHSSGVKINGNLIGVDSKKIQLGNDADLQIWHDGSNSYLQNATGELHLRSNTLKLTDYNSSHTYLRGLAGNTTELYFDNSKKLETTTSGVTVTGTVTATSFSGSGANLTNLPAGGNTITATAEGSIDHLKAVQIRTDGKVEQIGTTLSEISPTGGGGGWASDSAQYADDFKSPTCVWDPDADKNSTGEGSLMIFWSRGDGGGAKDPIVSTIPSTSTGGSWSYETQEEVDSCSIQSWGDISGCYDTNANKHVAVMINHSNSKQPTAKVGTYNTSNYKVEFGGSLQNFGSQNNNNHTIKCVFEPGTGKVVAILRAGWNGSTTMGCVGTVSGNSITWGSTVSISGASSVGEQCQDICLADSGKVLVVWRETDMSGLYVNLCTVSSSSNTMTVGSATQVNNDSTYEGFKIAYSKDSDYAIVAYMRSGKLYCRRITVSGSTLSVSSESSQVTSNTVTHVDVTWLPGIDKIGMSWIDQGDSNKPKFSLISNSSGTPTFNSAQTIEGSSYGNMWKNCVVGTGANERVAIGHQRKGNQNRGKFSMMKYIDNTTNRVGWRYIGYADQSYSNGNTAKVLTYGNVKTGLSGLSAGTIYFVGNDGTLITSNSANTDATGVGESTMAGMALSSSSLLIREPLAKSQVDEY